MIYKITHQPSNDTDLEKLVSVDQLFSLVEGAPFEEELKTRMKATDRPDELIPIEGLYGLIGRIKAEESKLKREDVKIKTGEVERLYEKGELKYRFTQNESLHQAKPLYSADRDFLEVYKIGHPLTKHLEAHGLEKHISAMREDLDAKSKEGAGVSRSLRLVHREGESFLRAVTSVSGYKDYGVRFSLVAVAMSITDYAKKTGQDFRVSRAEISESHIIAYFSSKSVTKIDGVGRVSFGVSLDNDELKRGALHINALVTLIPDSQARAIALRPPHNEARYKMRVSHGANESTAFERLAGIGDFISSRAPQLLEDMQKLGHVTRPDMLRLWLRNRVKESRAADFSGSKSKLLDKLNEEVQTTGDLLHLMDKLDDIAGEMSARHELAYMYYELILELQNSK